MTDLADKVFELVGNVEWVAAVTTGLAALLAVYFARGKTAPSSDTPVKDAVSNAVTPLTCAWGDIEKAQLDDMRRKVADIEERLDRKVEPNLQTIQEKLAAINALVSRLP